MPKTKELKEKIREREKKKNSRVKGSQMKSVICWIFLLFYFKERGKN